ncbi:hypothetical protein RFM68_17560 [Mesorhizobium sp. MSK_1335]|uniref:Uncharacterized protein n=1 Tax=Mesorhizobium montanum TaxID=3072323 RepID=A0ABU4ZLS7_9HYPH|nr:hypothetical protein [Mesorhizobium sp. MSK_1335]MDX8526310.1 hypothetical protein [Mesorhizobium sp. MSK_1335]
MADESRTVRRKPVGTKRAKPGRKSEPVRAAGAAHPKRPRKTLVDDFAAALRADFRVHGAGVIAAVRAEKPEQYLKVVLTLLPKDFSRDLDADRNNLDRLSDEEIRSRIRGLEASLRPFLDDPGLSGPARGDGQETPL